MHEDERFVDGARNQLRPGIDQPPRARLPSFLFAGREPCGDLEPAASKPFAADHDGDWVALAWCECRRDPVERQRAAGRVKRIVEVAEPARLFTEGAGNVGVGAFLERRYPQ